MSAWEPWMAEWVYEVAWPHARVPVPERPCIACGVDCVRGQWRHHLCDPCYMYAWRYGRPRPRHLIHPQPFRCPQCGRAALHWGRGWCRRCYSKWWRAVGAPERACGACGRRTRALERGCCARCYQRRRKLAAREAVA